MVKTFLFQLLVEEGLFPNIDQIASLMTQTFLFTGTKVLYLSQQQKCARRKNCDWLKFVSIAVRLTVADCISPLLAILKPFQVDE